MFDSKCPPKEGDMYGELRAHGKVFTLYYGYYEEKDRLSRYNEPAVIYPDFINDPVYTDDGIPFATAIQDPCRHFKGERNEDSTCYHCTYYSKCAELIGVCTCADNKINNGNK